MAEETMPVTEANVAPADEAERAKYEFAFHVLPTVTEGEVEGVFTTLKDVITKAGGTLFDEEAPKRLDLAYDITKAIEGKNRKFHSAYFGWVRFELRTDRIEGVTEDLEALPSILRALTIRLTRLEEANPFRYHEAHKETKVRVVEDREVVAPVTEDAAEAVSEVQLDESLDKITEDSDVKEDDTKKE